MKKTLFALVVCMFAANSFAGVINYVQPNGDGCRGKDRYGFFSSWYDSGYYSNANPNTVYYDYDSGSANGSWRNAFMEVSLAGLPAVEDITMATLNINILSLQGSGKVATVNHAANSGAATGNASDQISCTQLVGYINDTTGLGWASFDITDYIKADLQNGYSWAAFTFVYSSYHALTFSSGESATCAPYLEVIPEPCTMGLLGLGSLLIARRKRS